MSGFFEDGGGRPPRAAFTAPILRTSLHFRQKASPELAYLVTKTFQHTSFKA